MDIRFFHVAAFAEQAFTGNPAIVCLPPEELPDATMQAIASEFNLSETAFVRPLDENWSIRWFTPATEIKLCGHATLAAAHVLVNEGRAGTRVRFSSASGPLTVSSAAGGMLVLDFPVWRPEPCPLPDVLPAILSCPVSGTWQSNGNLLAVVDSEETVRTLAPDMARLAAFEQCQALIVTAPGRQADFVSRCFAPRYGINEDPVTGAAHCLLTPYWAERLEKQDLIARQLSSRGGLLFCTWDGGDRVRIGGRALNFAEGTLRV